MYIQILDKLILQEQKKLTELEIFTASYHSVPIVAENYQLPHIDTDEIIYDLDLAKSGVIDFFKKPFGTHKNLQEISTMHWLFGIIDKQCPNRKIGSFRKLKTLNQKIITIYDIYRITFMRNKNDFIVNEVEEKVKAKM